jgi:hypothetical protein
MEYLKKMLTRAGGKCGSTTIDRNFIKWMKAKFGSKYTSVPLEKRRLGGKFMNEFERQKRNFGATGGESYFEIESIDMDAPNSAIYDKDEATVKLSRYECRNPFSFSTERLLQI